jgi:hypothetical protein
LNNRNPVPGDPILPFVTPEFLLEVFLERLKVELDAPNVSRFRRPSYIRARCGMFPNWTVANFSQLGPEETKAVCRALDWTQSRYALAA